MSLANQTEPRPPSRMAIVIAVMRAIGAKHPEAPFRNSDYLAARFVGPREQALLPDDLADALDLDFEPALARLPDPHFVTINVARTRFFDDALAAARVRW